MSIYAFQKKRKMKKITILGVALLATVALSACDNKKEPAQKADNAPVVLKVAATPVPHGEILRFVAPQLKKNGVDLQITEFTDFISPNTALADKSVDANYYQHIPFLENAMANKGYKFSIVSPIHILPMAAYSEKVKDLKDLQQGAKVSIPNDPSNGGRALLLLEKGGVLKLKPNVGSKATTLDIVENPKGIKIIEVEAAQVPRTLKDVDVAVANSNYAIGVGLNPLKDSILLEDKDSPFVVVLATRAGDEKKSEVQKLAKALKSKETKDFMNEKYKGSVVPLKD